MWANNSNLCVHKIKKTHYIGSKSWINWIEWSQRKHTWSAYSDACVIGFHEVKQDTLWGKLVQRVAINAIATATVSRKPCVRSNFIQLNQPFTWSSCKTSCVQRVHSLLIIHLLNSNTNTHDLRLQWGYLSLSLSRLCESQFKSDNDKWTNKTSAKKTILNASLRRKNEKNKKSIPFHSLGAVLFFVSVSAVRELEKKIPLRNNRKIADWNTHNHIEIREKILDLYLYSFS